MPVPSAMPGVLNAGRGAALAHASGIFQDILVAGRSNFENVLATEATWVLNNHPHHVHFTSNPQGRFTSTPRRHPEEDRSMARVYPATYPPRYEMKVAVQEFCKLCKPKINKLKGRYSATANLNHSVMAERHQSHVEDWDLTEREAIQLVKDLTAERAHDEVYMGMITDDQQTFDGLVNHLKNAFQSGETVSELIIDFYGHPPEEE